MSLWVDKHRPTSLAKLDYHKELSSHLKKLVGFHNIYHRVFIIPRLTLEIFRICCFVDHLVLARRQG